ncbi:IS3 family transposase [Streptomyces sp. NBC_01618]|uniref:IS3 family transposase n=1 Tax=Streptomyces sp. NBC_01618 TaxID=2975900 RepID=UPI00386D97FE
MTSGHHAAVQRVVTHCNRQVAEKTSLKRETMHRRVFVTMSQARLEIFRWLTYYNARRRHSALSYLSPMEFEQHHHKTAKLSLAA